MRRHHCPCKGLSYAFPGQKRIRSFPSLAPGLSGSERVPGSSTSASRVFVRFGAVRVPMPFQPKSVEQWQLMQRNAWALLPPLSCLSVSQPEFEIW